MSKFVKNVKFEIEFEGDRVEFVARPVDKASAATLYAVIALAKRPDAAAEGLDKGAQDPVAALDALAKAFSDHLLSVAGLRDADGNAVSKETMFDTLYFMELVNDAAAKWAKGSLPETQPGK